MTHSITPGSSDLDIVATTIVSYSSLIFTQVCFSPSTRVHSSQVPPLLKKKYSFVIVVATIKPKHN